MRQSIRAAVGDAAVVWRAEHVELTSSHGVLARWPRPPMRVASAELTRQQFSDAIVSAVVLDDPPRLAVFLRSGTVQARYASNDRYRGRGGGSSGDYGSGRINFSYDAEDDPNNAPVDHLNFDSGGVIAFVDVATGTVESDLRQLAGVQNTVAFVPGGDRIVCAADAGVFIVDNAGAGITDVKVPGPPITRVVFAVDAEGRDGRAIAAFGVADARQDTDTFGVEVYPGERGRLTCVDVDRAAIVWQRDFERVTDVVLADPQGHSLVVIGRDNGSAFVAVLNGQTGETRKVVGERSGKAGAFRQLSVAGATLARIACVDDFHDVNVATADGDAWSVKYHRGTPTVAVNARAGVFVTPGQLEPPLPIKQQLCALDDARVLGTLDGATHVCFAGSPSMKTAPHAVFLKDGVVHLVDAGSPSGTPLEGASDLMALASHPRGVIALDHQGAAHVVDV